MRVGGQRNCLPCNLGTDVDPVVTRLHINFASSFEFLEDGSPIDSNRCLTGELQLKPKRGDDAMRIRLRANGMVIMSYRTAILGSPICKDTGIKSVNQVD